MLLEKKSKYTNLCAKEQVLLTREEVQATLQGFLPDSLAARDPLLKELAYKMTIQQLRPRTIVEYTRDPYVYSPGNVRVTLDYHLRTGLGSLDFLNPQSVTIPVAPAPVILEVKWDQYLPSLVRDLVQLEGRHTSPFSKYAACRIYG